MSEKRENVKTVVKQYGFINSNVNPIRAVHFYISRKSRYIWQIVVYPLFLYIC